MIEKTTTNRNYPKPDAKNFLQDDVTRLESALDSIDTDIHTINTTKADQTALQSAIDTINNTKADKTEVDSKIAALKEKIYSTAYNIIGPPLVFQYTTGLTYSIEIPDAATYAWTATGVTITAGAASKSITVSAGTASGSVSVSVTTNAGNTVEKTKEITVRQLSNIVTFDYTGTIESWTVPDNVELIKIEAWGAEGGSNNWYMGGKGAYMSGNFNIPSGTEIQIVVGQKGTSSTTYRSAGGGGSFAWIEGESNPLIAAGGGGGGGSPSIGCEHGTTHINGNNGHTTNSTYFGGLGGSDGHGGNFGTGSNSSSHYAGGGAGWFSDGTGDFPGKGKISNFSIATGADSSGGFGGGGGVKYSGAGGGGGYSGGGGGGWGYGTPNSNAPGGGGGSYNAGTNQVNLDGIQVGHGKIVITYLQQV